jgi:hypothetical protein
MQTNPKPAMHFIPRTPSRPMTKLATLQGPMLSAGVLRFKGRRMNSLRIGKKESARAAYGRYTEE